MKLIYVICLFLGLIILFLSVNALNASGINENKCSKPNNICKDTTPPEIKNFSYFIVRTKIKFIFEIDENNFKDIFYKDTAICKTNCEKKIIKYGTLCRSLHNGKCSAVRNFCKGEHYIEITIRDKTGNINSEIKENIVI